MADMDCDICQFLYCGNKLPGADVQSFIARMLCNIRDLDTEILAAVGGGGGGGTGPEYQVLYDLNTYDPVVVRITYDVDGNPTGSTAFNLDGTPYVDPISGLVPSTRLDSPVYQQYYPAGPTRVQADFSIPGGANVPVLSAGVNRLIVIFQLTNTASGNSFQVIGNAGSGDRLPILGQNAGTGVVQNPIDPLTGGAWIFDVGGFVSPQLFWDGSGTGDIDLYYSTSGGN